MPHTYKFVIYCSTFPTLKNSKQIKINSKTHRPFISSSPEWDIWYQEAVLQANVWKGKCKYPLPFKRCAISIVCFFQNMRNHDLDGIESGILDLLKSPKKKKNGLPDKNEKGTGIIQDDDFKLLRPISIDAGISLKTPRIEVFITPVEDLSFRTK